MFSKSNVLVVRKKDWAELSFLTNIRNESRYGAIFHFKKQKHPFGLAPEPCVCLVTWSGFGPNAARSSALMELTARLGTLMGGGGMTKFTSALFHYSKQLKSSDASEAS